MLKIEDIVNSTENLKLDESSHILIGYPVHAFNSPKIVVDFAKKLPSSNGQKVSIFNQKFLDELNSKLSADTFKLLKQFKNQKFNKEEIPSVLIEGRIICDGVSIVNLSGFGVND